ncbi:hypothetical protein KFU94_16615 [Chloroflexi bacterium TSY]|nr:hypothetical protein [Chloroflexi bacterium TSY]
MPGTDMHIDHHIQVTLDGVAINIQLTSERRLVDVVRWCRDIRRCSQRWPERRRS